MKIAAIVMLGVTTTAFAGTERVSLPLGVQTKVIAAAEGVRIAIRTGNVRSLIEFMSRKEGLECTDAKVPFRDIRQSLANRQSILYLSLFDSKNLVARCGGAYPADAALTSDREFFENSPTSPILIEWVSDAKDYVTVKYESGAYPSRKYTFHREPSGWRIVSGLLAGDCTCG